MEDKKQLQARLYYRILKDNISKDDYFKDFKILNYRFIFCNRDTCNPLVWEYEDTTKVGTLYYGRYKHIAMPDPEDLGRDLNLFLTKGVKAETPYITERNSLTKWINTL